MNVEEEVIIFLARETGVNPASLTLSTRLCTDLGIAGDTGDELIRRFAKKYSVDLQYFDAADYFGKEGGNPLILLFPGLESKLKPLTVADLVRVAQGGTWKV